MMITRRTIHTLADPWFPAFWAVYNDSFPFEERRTKEAQERIFTNSRYNLEIWHDEKNLLGLAGWWQYEQYRYLEHLAINGQIRSKGYGQRFMQEWMQDSNQLLIIEIDYVQDEITTRRLHFYERLGFIRNNYEHTLPCYQTGLGAVPLEILSYPTLVPQPIFDDFRHRLFTDVLAPGLPEQIVDLP